MVNIKDLYGKSVILYGFGAYGKLSYDILQSIESIKIVGIIDDFKKGELKNELTIYSLEEFLLKNIKYDTILITSSFHSLLNNNLRERNLFGVYFDLFRMQSSKKITVLKNKLIDLSFYTPNYFTELAAKNLEFIEPETIQWIRNFKPNKVFFDIGASNGSYSLVASSINKTTSYAFEPDIKNFSLMNENIQLNLNELQGEILSFNVALDNVNGISNLNKLEDYSGAHSKILEKYNRNDSQNICFENQQKVLTFSLDQIIKNHINVIPNYLKIDVDGAELSVLRGAKNILKDKNIEEILIETEIANEKVLIAKMKKLNFNLRGKFKINEIIGGEIQGTSNYLFKR